MNSQNNFKILISRKQIKKAIKRLAIEIANDFKDKSPLFIGILKGSFVFLADLIRQLNFDLEIEFIKLSSYGDKTTSSGTVEEVIGLRRDIKNRDVIVVEDIVDTGYTTSFFLDWVKSREPKSLRLCALTNKPARREIEVQIDYLGFTIPNKFIIGYGIDYNEKYRNLPDICYIE